MKKFFWFILILLAFLINFSLAQYCSTNNQGNYHCTYDDGHYEYRNTDGSHYDSRTQQLDWSNNNFSQITSPDLSSTSCPGDSTLWSDGNCYCVWMNENYWWQCIRTTLVGICEPNYYWVDIETDPFLWQCTRHPEIYPGLSNWSCLRWYSINSRWDRCEISNITTNINTYANSYTDELQGAYNYAYQKGITTQTSIDNADMYWSLLRSHMAKMMVNYSKEVLWKTVGTSISCTFNDISRQTIELQWYIKEACQLGIMWVWLSSFNPNGIVTRAEFWTVLSRALFGDTYNWWKPYYMNHLRALKDANIMSNINTPSSTEVRWYVMLMLQRSENIELDSNSINTNSINTNSTNTSTTNKENCTPEQILTCHLGLVNCVSDCQ